MKGCSSTRLCIAVLVGILALLVLSPTATASVATSGRYNLSRPTNLEIEPNPTPSCSQGNGVSATCHLLNATFPASKAGTARDGSITSTWDHKTWFNLGDGATRGDTSIAHPGAERGPASMFPLWVHQQHGLGNWPTWNLNPNYPVNYTVDPNWINSSLYSASAAPGKRDQDVGDNIGNDQGNRRFPAQAENNVGPYWGKKIKGDSIIMSGEDPNQILALAFIAYPTADKDRTPAGLPSCTYGSQGNSYENTTDTVGCHGIYEPYKAKADNYRSDEPACTKCHTTITSGAVTSTNSKHGSATNAQFCRDCHKNASQSPTADKLADNTVTGTTGFIPMVRECWECHSGTKLGASGVNTTFAHSGKDCRYCHGHGHNITRQLNWNTTCGNNDDICHGSGSTKPQTTLVTHNKTGSSTPSPTCFNCHGSSTAHNITIPGCNKCHNSTSTWGAARINGTGAIPAWDSSNAIYHGGADKKCSDCHQSSPHSRPVKRESCGIDNSSCHGSGATKVITQTHSNLSCTDCHNNNTIKSYSGNLQTINTNFHATERSTSGANMTPFNISSPIQKSDCTKCHDNSSYIDPSLSCDSCHTDTSQGKFTVHSSDMEVASREQGKLGDGRHDAGGPNCTQCHWTGSNENRPDVNITVFNQSIHRWINNASEPGIDENESINRACRGCHVTNGEASHHNRYTYCWDCHNGTAMYSNVSNAPAVREHYNNASELNISLLSGDINSSCVTCHNKTEMLLDFWENATTTKGRNTSFYNVSHYGKKRTDLRYIENGKNVTYCIYCHQNSSTAFSDVMQNTEHISMSNHSPRMGAPTCSNETCHNQGRIHDVSLTKPQFNATLCRTCHTDRYNHSGSKPTGGVNCTECHTNTSKGGWDIHGINGTYLQNTGNTYGPNTTAVNCSTCHQTDTPPSLINTPPRIPSPLNHSNNESAGQLWGDYWNDTDSVLSNDSCYYCHGDTKHNATGLGNVSIITGTVNGSINSTSQWCRSCHYNDSTSIYKGNNFSPRPPEITNDTGEFYNKAPSKYYNHSFTDTYNDTKCDDCHAPSPTPTNITAFMHNVQIGVAGGRNCTNCHDIGGSAPKHINVSAFNRSIHANLNNNTDPGSGIPNVTTACWACHGDGTDPGNSHPSNYKNPYTCSDCHVQGGANYGKYPNAKNVSEHYNNGADVNVSKLTGDVDSSCAYCHYGKSEMLLSASEINDPDTVSWSIYSGYNGGNNSASHYGKKRFVSGDGLYTAGGYTNCSYCHQNTATNFADAMENLNNINLYNHTNRTGGPYCTNSTCHGSGRIHDAILTKPYLNSTHQSGGMYNSTLCISCHANRRVHADAGDINANTLECASCHANPTAYSASGGGAGYFSISYDRVVMRDTDGSYSGNGSPSEAMVGDPASAKISSNIEPTVKTGGLLDKIGKWFSSGINSAKALLDNIEKELFKPSIEIVNPESRPRLGGEWEVYFKTKGSGVLEIRDHSFPEEVGFIALLYKKIGDQWIPVPIEISGDLIRAQWNHGEGKAIFKPLTTGKHTVELKFGNYAYAYNYVEPEVNFDRRLEGLKTGQHKVPPTTEIEITITATVSSTVENAILRDYVPKDFTIIKTYGGTIKEYNSEYNVIEWEVGTVNKSISKKYTVYSPERTIPPTKYYFYSELSHDGGSRTSDKWRVTVADPNTLIIRPNADGTLNDWSIGGTSPPANRWEAVDETTQNDDTDYVYATSQNLDQFFNLQDHTTETGTIDNVTVYIYAKQTTGNEYLQVCIWDNTYCQNTPTISTSYTLYSYSWTTDPSDSLAWTWSDIDALEAGVRSKNSGGWGGEIRVTQLYVEISYTPAAADNPPTWRNQMQNVSTINVSGAVNLSAQGNDDNGLWQAYLETNESGGTWANITDGTYGSPITLNNVTSWTWTNFTWSNSSIGPGTSIGWRIWYKDNATTPQWNVTDIMTFDVVDEVPPVITSKSINESGSVTVDTYVCINTTVTDNWQLDKVWSVLTYPNGTTENVSLANTGVPCASGDTYGAEVNVGSTQGTFYFNASYANDTSGNIGSNTTVQSLTVTSVDNTPPYNISFIPPTPDNATTLPSTQNWTTINVTVEDASSSIDTCLLEWNGTNESMTIDGSGLSVYCWSNKTDLSNGVYGYRVYANDSSGNINVSEYREVTIAYTPTYKQIYRYYVKFDISSIPQGATVNAANLTVNVTRAASGAIGVVNRTTGDYDSTSGNDTVWADSSGTKSSGGTFDASTTGLKNITITEAVQAAVNEGEGFVAFVITELNEDADQNFTIAGSQSGWPKLYINYSTNPQKQIHGIRYIRKDGTYSTPYDSSNVANCTSCHQGNIASVNGTSTPQIPSSITHSNGSKWNTSPGYWDATNNLSACLYCHGNTTHNDTALGNASQGLVDTNYVNGSINTTSYWCSGCHREDYANYYGDTLYPIPPTINASGNYYPSSGSPIDHTGFIASDSSDSKCFECHKGSLTGDPKIDVFLHKVSEGRAGGENCTTCHDLGGSAPSLLNISAFREGVHAGLNNYSSDLGPNSGSSADTINYACWACHGNGSSPGSQHPSNYKSPYNCTSCHLESGSRAGVFYGARNVTEHFKEGEDIQAATSYPNNITSCLSCHNKSEMILYNGNVGDPDFGGFSDTDGDGVVGGNYSFYHYGKNRTSDLVVNGYTNCSYCHQDASDSFGAPDVTEHTEVGVNVSVTKTCVNSDCHNSGRIHDATLKIRTDIAPWTSGANDRCAPCHNSTGPGSSIVIYNHTSSVSGITDCSYCHDSNAKGSGGSYLILHNSSLQQPYDSSSYQCSNCHQNAEDDYNARDIYAHSNSSSSTLNVNGSDCGRCHKTDYSAFTAGDNLHNSTLIKPSETQCTECHQSASDSVSAVDVYEHTTAAAANGRDINISRECTDSGCHWNGTGSTPTMLHNDTLEVKTIYEFNPSNSDVDRCAPCHNSSSSWSTINVTDHTPRATGPSCVNSTCHSGQKLHTDSIKKPATMFNDSLCLECHSDRQQHASYDLPEVADSNNLNCTDCHANWQSSEKQIHGINNSYLQQDLASYGANTTAVNCTSCHTNSTAVINGTSAPYIGSSLRHSNNESAGQLWGDYWNDTDSVLSNDSCYYCHGDTKHNATALGYVSILNVDNNYVNGSVNGTSQWCRSCHYNDSTSIYKGNNFSPRPPEITNDTGEFYNRNPSGYELHTGSSYLGNDSTCSNCHKASSEDDPGMDRFVHNVKIGVAGGRNCTSCHYLGSSNAPKHLNLSAMNISDNAHYMLNNRSGDPGTTDTSGSDWNNRRCWACHSNGTNPADSHNKTKYKSPWTCPDCHLSSGAMNSVFNWSAAGLSNVSEHYRSGSDIQATAFEASDLESCLNCHEYRDDISQPMSEMLIPNVNDPDYGSFTGDGVRPSETGGNYSFYHYGKKRFKSGDGLYTAGGYTNCSYCHQNSSTGFDFTDTKSYLKSIEQHTTRQQINCTNSTCHNSGRIHDSTLQKPTLSISNDTICVTCHGSRERHAGSVNCTQCHTNTSKDIDIHPIKYLLQNNTFSTSNSSAVNCTTCHTTSAITGTNNLDPPRVPQLNHSNGSKWSSTPYWNDSAGSMQNSSCYYCHGDTKHNSTALGKSSGAQQAWDYINGTINTTSTWCQDCHYNGSSNYIGSLFSPAPPEITNATGLLGSVSGYFNHSLGSYNDSACFSCHGNNTLGDKLDEFMHNISIGKASGSNPKNCTSCHALPEEGGSGAAPKTINRTAFNSTYSIHRLLNRTESGDENTPCWACHGNGTAPSSDMNHSTWPNLKNPKACPACHDQGNFSAPVVYKHSPTSSAVTTTAECESCHNNSMITNTGDTATNWTALVSHYGTNQSLKPGGTYNTTKCINCHKKTLAEDPVDGCAEASSATERAKWGNPPIVTMGQCDETLCWTCHMSANENKKPGESIETPDNFHSATIVDMMWNCQRCHVID